MEININCDLGESSELHSTKNDPLLLNIVNSANIACGYHAGDKKTMEKTIETSKINKVSIGAHPHTSRTPRHSLLDPRGLPPMRGNHPTCEPALHYVFMCDSGFPGPTGRRTNQNLPVTYATHFAQHISLPVPRQTLSTGPTCRGPKKNSTPTTNNLSIIHTCDSKTILCQYSQTDLNIKIGFPATATGRL